MDETTAANVLRWYESLEGQIVDFIKVVPLHTINKDTWSPTLATVLVDACNLLESILYHITPEPVTVPTKTGSQKTKSRKDLKLEHYMALYSEKLRLPERKVVLFQAPQEWRIPFRQSFPPWWNTHNRSKHRRLDHVHNFTLHNALDALAGAFVVITTVPFLEPARSLISAMVQHGWIDTPAPELLGSVPKFYAGSYPSMWLCPETELFTVPLGNTSLPDAIQGLPRAFRPAGRRVVMGGKLRRWLALGC